MIVNGDNIPCEFSIYENKIDNWALDNRPGQWRNLANLLNFLSQETTVQNYVELANISPIKMFEGVWDRKTAMFHASFADSTRQYIGCNKDFWMIPTKFYKYTNGSYGFNVRFSTDGKNHFSHMIVQ
jgi:hypothetical protein